MQEEISFQTQVQKKKDINEMQHKGSKKCNVNICWSKRLTRSHLQLKKKILKMNEIFRYHLQCKSLSKQDS